MNNKNYFIFAAAIALASCSVDEYMGENPEFTQTTKENIIGFGGGTGSMSRATSNSGTTNQKLDNHFKVYGCKLTATPGTYQPVFDNYWVWYSANATPSNPNAGPSAYEESWEYVGTTETDMPFGTSLKLHKIQTIKYWDYSAEHYRFVAGTPQNQVEFTIDNKKKVTGAKITGLAGHINPNTTGTALSTNPVYISNPIQINKNSSTIPKYGEAVPLKFTRFQTKVRVGIYETIPGYSISSISFYKQEESTGEGSTVNLTRDNTNEHYIILTSTGKNFYGGESVSATVKYHWDDDNNNSNPSFTYSYSTTGAEAYNWYGGKFTGVTAQSSNPATASELLYGSDKDMDNTGYFTVIPNNNENAITIKCDYTLTSDDNSGETINVKGATAAIPAAYCKWEPNKMYTYIFKISQETNGTTGGTGDKPGLFPITFDATVIAEAANQQGTETIINAPSITTHQAGSVTDNGIQYQYVTNKQIDITVTDDKGDLQDLNTTNTSISKGYIAVYKLTGEKTEAQLTVTAPTETAVSSLNVETNKASFIPDADAYYAIQYCYSVTDSKSVYKYKVIKVGNPTSSGS